MKVPDFDACYDEKRYSQFWDEVKRGGSVKLESVHVRKDGSRFPVEMTISHVKQGEKEYAFNFIRDITERKRTEEALKESKTFLNNVFESIQDGISVLDASLNIVSVNPVMEKWYGTGIAGKKCFEVYHGRHSPCEKCPSVRAMRERTTKSEVVQDIRTWVEIYAFPLIDNAGQVIGVIEQVRDVTERKLAEEALRESEEKFRVLAESSTAMFWLYQGERFVYVNGAGERLTGYTVDELLRMRFWDVVHPDDRDMVRERGLARQWGEPVPQKYEIKLLTRGGETRFVELTAGRIMYRGEPAGVATFFDITERKQAEEALNMAKHQAELYVDLMGHDINNFNLSAMGYLELALQALEAEKRLKLEDKLLIERPMQALANSSELISNVRKLQRLMAEGVKTRSTYLDQIFRELEGMSFHSYDRHVAINIQHVPGIMVEANELLKDAFANLIANAVKHSDEEKPLTVNVKAELVDENGKKYYRCTVEDDGPGIPDALKNKVFHRFQRGATKARGKGLGLYLVRTLVEGYHGKVWVEDRIHGDHTKGARFVVMLPAIDQ